jgi:hypothetical protein
MIETTKVTGENNQQGRWKMEDGKGRRRTASQQTEVVVISPSIANTTFCT